MRQVVEGELVGKNNIKIINKYNGFVIWRRFGFKISDEQRSDVFCTEWQNQVPTKVSSMTNLFQHNKVHYEGCINVLSCGLQPRL